MACDVQSLIAAAAANGYSGLDDRGLTLALVGSLSAAQGNITANAVMEAGKSFQKLTEQQLDDAIAAHLCDLLA